MGCNCVEVGWGMWAGAGLGMLGRVESGLCTVSDFHRTGIEIHRTVNQYGGVGWVVARCIFFRDTAARSSSTVVATALADTTWPKPTQMSAITVYALAFLAADINDATVTAVCLDRLGCSARNHNNSSPAAKGLTFTKTGICIDVSAPTAAGASS